MMRSNEAGFSWMVPTLAAFALGADLPGQNPKAIEAAGLVFQRRCASCHTIPDPSVRTDRGWLDQLNRTA